MYIQNLRPSERVHKPVQRKLNQELYFMFPEWKLTCPHCEKELIIKEQRRIE